MKRNYGVDFLRIISMFMVVILHVLGHGGILKQAEPFTTKYWIAWLLEISCYCAVNCFALISGYVMSDSNYKLSRVFNLWFQTVFYTGLTTIVFFFVPGVAVGGRAILNAIFPITSKQYWYISAYIGMLLFAPLLNAVIEHAEKSILFAFLFSIFVLSCTLPIVFQSSPYGLDEGYSVIWLIILYLAGGYLRKYEVANKIKTVYAWIAIFSMITLAFVTKFILETFFQGNSFILSYNNCLISYTSPTMILIAIGLLIVCSKMNVKPVSAKILRFVSPAVLGVYLFHENPFIRNHLIKASFKSFSNYDCLSMLCLVVLSAFVIFIAGIFIDFIRIKLFALLRINKLSIYFEKKLAKKLDSM